MSDGISEATTEKPTPTPQSVGYTGHTPPNHRDIVTIAAACHMANRAYCVAIGDNSQVPWWQLDEETLDSAVDGVCNALNGATPEQSHINWMKFKKGCGWKYGVEKDPVNKEHPCMVPYGDLPEEQRRKDGLFLDMVRAVGGRFPWFAGTTAGRNLRTDPA